MTRSISDILSLKVVLDPHNAFSPSSCDLGQVSSLSCASVSSLSCASVSSSVNGGSDGTDLTG